MATLSNKHKAFIVRELAHFEKPTDIQEEFNERFNVEVSLSQISYYNPNNAQGSRQLAQDWKELFNESRRKFIEGINEEPIAHKRYRLKKLQKAAEKFENMKNYKGVAEILEQAAKEVGGAYTNKKEIDLNGLMKSIDLDRLTDQQLERIAHGEHPIAVLSDESTGEAESSP